MIGRAEIARLRAVMRDRLGLSLEETRESEITDALLRRSRARRMPDVGRYLETLEDGDVEEAQALGQFFTVGETYFFRTRGHYDVVRDVILPRSWERGAVRALSAGCSSGEEPYSLAMLLRDEGWDGVHRGARIDAVDVDERSLAKARRAIYTPWSLRETEPVLRRRWFVTRGRDFEVVPEVRDLVVFHRANLFGEASLFAPDTFDFVFCRNVLMYFTPDAARAVVARLTDQLAPGGYLFLGHAETVRGLSDAYDLQNTHGAFYYRKPLPPAVLAPSPRDEVHRASPDASPPMHDAHEDVLELLARERFADALAALADRDDVQSAVLRAVAALGTGDLATVETECSTLLAEHAYEVEAHSLLALAAEHTGDAERASEHHRTAVYFDPDFAIARLHLGRLARRQGRTAEARRELELAQGLLERESATRIALFGGGFTRESLRALCRSELHLLERPS